MLHLIPKERFEERCLGKQPNIKIDHSFDYKIEWPYYEIPETDSYLLYIKELGLCLIFGEEPKNYEIDYSDWKLVKVSEKPNPKYILNIMKSCIHLSYDFNLLEAGEWKIENTRFSYDFLFSIKICGDYFKHTAIGYEEKLEIPINSTVVRLKDKLIEGICNGIRGDNKKSSIGS